MPGSRRICTGEPPGRGAEEGQQLLAVGHPERHQSFRIGTDRSPKKGHEGTQTEPNDSDATHLPQIDGWTEQSLGLSFSKVACVVKSTAY